MVLNGTREKLLNVEHALQEICRETQNMCTVFAMYDFAKDMSHTDVIRKRALPKKGSTVYRKAESEKIGTSYWSLEATDSMLAEEALEKMQ